VRVFAALLVFVAAAAACSTGGSYVKSDRDEGMTDRGETNGRMFDFVSNMPEGDDWQIRIRDNSLWAAYGDREKVKELGTKPLTKKESAKVWELVEAVDIPSRKKGQEDEDEGWVSLRLREPGDEQHDIFTIYISRADAEDDEEVLDLAAYLQDLVEKHFKKKPEF
jgi:hypothetical protein